MWDKILKKVGFKEVDQELPNFQFEFKNISIVSTYENPDNAKTIVGVSLQSELVTMRAQDFFSLVKEAGHAKTVFCPDCKSPEIKKDGKNYKGGQVYACLNNSCKRVNFTEIQ